jgi:hypothetical protein
MTLIIVAILFVALISAFAFHRYVREREIANRELAQAVRTFHGAADKLLKTSDDLPEPLTAAIAAMAKLAFGRRTPKQLLRSVREEVSSVRARPGRKRVTTREIEQVKSSLRTELNTIVGELSLAWFSIVANQSVVYKILINRELKRGLTKYHNGSGNKDKIEESEQRVVLKEFLKQTSADLHAA